MEILKDPHFIGQFVIAAFVSIVFLQSGLDKVFDWKGNYSWLSDHFKSTFLSGLVAPMLAVVTLMELAAGLVALCGIYCLVFCEDSTCIQYSLTLALITLLMLIFGQRIAKDYDGAKTIAIYIAVCLIGLMLFM